jgi:hypothetical protein
MSNFTEQNFKNHRRIDPPFHLVLFLFLMANLVFAIFHLVRHRSDSPIASAWFLVLSLVVFIPFYKLRSYPLKVQDRVIRLEERLRLEALAPVEWRAQIHRLTEDQLIGLRFASDQEVVGLAKRALEKNLSGRQIKEQIQNWRSDTWRV